MTTAYWCVLFALMLPYVFTFAAKFTGRGFGLRTNHDPRRFLDQLQGARKRAHYAQLNSFEVTPAFSAAVIISHLAGAAQPSIDHLALAFVISRVLFGICYIADWATLRSLVWFFGMACIVGLFIVAS